jgi:DNA polymerase III subunit delta
VSKAAAGAAGVRLLLGSEEGEKAAFIEQVRASLASVGEAPEVTRFYAGDAGIAEVVRCLRNQTLFARHRLVILASTENVRKADDVALLVDYINAPAPDATLLLVSSGFASEIDRRVVAAVPKDAQKVFWEMFDNQKPGWIVTFFRQRKIAIAPEAADHILDMVENNTRDLRAECERLALFFGPDTTLGLEDVEQYIYHSKEENVFTLFDRLCERDLAAALGALDAILLSREAEAAQLAAGLLAQFRKLASLKRMLADNYAAEEAFPKLRIMSKRNQKTYRAGAGAFSLADVRSIQQLLTAFDERFRSVRTEMHELLLHLLVYYIVRRAGQGAWQLSL